MVCLNELTKLKSTSREVKEALTILLAPFCPHLAEELWHLLGKNTTVCDAPWPAFNEDYLKEDSVKMMVAFNGKARFQLEFPADVTKRESCSCQSTICKVDGRLHRGKSHRGARQDDQHRAEKMTKSNIFHELKDYALISVGVILYAMGVTVFMLPYSLTTGGVAGVASIIYYATGIEVQVTYVIVNIILLIIAIKELGIRFCMKTIYAVFFMTFVLWLFQRIIEIPDPNQTGAMMLPKFIGEESFMACVLGAILCGSGVALCFENNGSTGGTDIIAAIVNKHRNMSLGSVIMSCDVVIISSCYFIFHDWFRVIYGFVMLFICSTTIDYWMRRRQQSVQFMIFSRNPDAIADAIIETHHGVASFAAVTKRSCSASSSALTPMPSSP